MKEKKIDMIRFDPLWESNFDPDRLFLFPIYEIEYFTELILKNYWIKLFNLILTKETRVNSYLHRYKVILSIKIELMEKNYLSIFAYSMNLRVLASNISMSFCQVNQ